MNFPDEFLEKDFVWNYFDKIVAGREKYLKFGPFFWKEFKC